MKINKKVSISIKMEKDDKKAFDVITELLAALNDSLDEKNAELYCVDDDDEIFDQYTYEEIDSVITFLESLSTAKAFRLMSEDEEDE